MFNKSLRVVTTASYRDSLCWSVNVSRFSEYSARYLPHREVINSPVAVRQERCGWPDPDSLLSDPLTGWLAGDNESLKYSNTALQHGVKPKVIKHMAPLFSRSRNLINWLCIIENITRNLDIGVVLDSEIKQRTGSYLKYYRQFQPWQIIRVYKETGSSIHSEAPFESFVLAPWFISSIIQAKLPQ